MSTGIMGVQSRQCPNCSASVDFNPEDVIITCSFCGGTFTQGRQEIKNHRLVEPKVSLQEAEKKIYNWIKKKTRFRGVKNIRVMKIEKLLIPYWVMESHVETFYRGYKRETVSETEYYTDSDGKRRSRTKHITIYKPVNREIKEDRFDPLICRMGATIFGLDEINKQVTRTVRTQNFTNFSIDKLRDNIEDVKFLSGEFKQSEAKEMIETNIQDEHRDRARAATTELFDCRTQIQLKDLEFLHYPIIYLEYASGKETYRVVMDGATERILLAELPITLRYRVMNEVIALFSATILLVVAIIFQQPLLNAVNSDNGGLYLFAFFGIMVILLIIGGYTNNVAWSTETRTKE